MRTIYFLVIFYLFSAPDICVPQKINEIEVPPGYQRIIFPEKTYMGYLQRLHLKKDNIIYEWDGSRLWTSVYLYNVLAVVDKPLLFKEDLEQCADYAMRFWADFHKDTGNLENLYLYDYHGNKKWYKDANKSYLKYLRWHLAFSNSYSIKNGAYKIDVQEKLLPGDMFVQNRDGGVGHVSVIVDVAENEQKERIYLIGYSYMPAQEFHIEDADNQDDCGAWFSKEGYMEYLRNSRLNAYGLALIRRF